MGLGNNVQQGIFVDGLAVRIGLLVVQESFDLCGQDFDALISGQLPAPSSGPQPLSSWAWNAAKSSSQQAVCAK